MESASGIPRVGQGRVGMWVPLQNLLMNRFCSISSGTKSELGFARRVRKEKYHCIQH